MSTTLSPAAARGIFTNLIEHQRDREEVKRGGNIEVVTMYRCLSCDETYEERSDALTCHPQQPGERARIACPVCDRETSSAHWAVECCLWRDLDAPTRWRLVQMVDGGMPMLEAIELVAGKVA